MLRTFLYKKLADFRPLYSMHDVYRINKFYNPDDTIIIKPGDNTIGGVQLVETLNS
jgi:hypothetical protein